MVTIDQVVKLREYVSLSFEQARELLEQTGGDVLEAVILSEKMKDSNYQAGYYQMNTQNENTFSGQEYYYAAPQSFGAKKPGIFKRFFAWVSKILEAGNLNHFQVFKNGDVVADISVIILILLFMFAFELTVFSLLLSLILGFRFRFTGKGFESLGLAKPATTPYYYNQTQASGGVAYQAPIYNYTAVPEPQWGKSTKHDVNGLSLSLYSDEKPCEETKEVQTETELSL